MELYIGGFGFSVEFGQGKAVDSGEVCAVEADVTFFVLYGFFLVPGYVGCGVIPVGGFFSLDVDSEVEGFVAVGTNFIAGKEEVAVGALFGDAVQDEGKGVVVAAVYEVCEGFDGFVGEAGYYAAEDFYGVYWVWYGGQWEDVADKGVEGGFLGFFSDGFEGIWEGCQGCVLDKGDGAFRAEYEHV